MVRTAQLKGWAGRSRRGIRSRAQQRGAHRQQPASVLRVVLSLHLAISARAVMHGAARTVPATAWHCSHTMHPVASPGSSSHQKIPSRAKFLVPELPAARDDRPDEMQLRVNEGPPFPFPFISRPGEHGRSRGSRRLGHERSSAWGAWPGWTPGSRVLRDRVLRCWPWDLAVGSHQPPGCVLYTIARSQPACHARQGSCMRARQRPAPLHAAVPVHAAVLAAVTP